LWKHISRDTGGHLYSAGIQQLQRDLATLLAAESLVAPGLERTLKEH
jgi:hypothetical protein